MIFGRRYITILFLLHFSSICYSQNFEWLRTFGAKQQDIINNINAEKKGGSAFLSYHSSNVNYTDTINFDTITIFNNVNWLNCLVRLDSNGNVIKARKVASNILGSRMSRDTVGNFYISGNIPDTITAIIGSVSMSKSNGTLVFSKFDKDLNFKWAVQTGNNTSTFTQEMIFSNGHLYFICLSRDTTKINTNTYIASNFYYVFGEINPNDGNIKWSKCLVKNNDNFRITGLLNLKNKLYLSCDFEISRGIVKPCKIVVGSDTLYGPGGCVIQTDTLGNYIKNFNFYNSKYLEVNCMNSDGEYLYLGGNFMDSLNWGKQKISSKYNSGGNYRKTQMYAASLTTDLKPRWFFRPNVLLEGQDNRVIDLVTSQGYIYLGAYLNGKILIDSNILYTAKGGALLFKTDFLGNVLWATTGGDLQSGIAFYTLDAIAGKSVFAGGLFVNTITLGKHKGSSKGIYDAWVTKISDYSITRGVVSYGPYCAGDTIKIPYTKFAEFDTSNIFIAQLSDENGNFESGYRELGRLKSNKDGTIIGKLPLFKVSSSPNYRIRILSTKPAVQSYYRRDTLRLLIYSKDKANPGPTETICYGDTIKLNTYGGTKWIWSPKTNMDDSTKRQPLVWPTKTITYKIIIGDSSGCGAPDTAYKQIVVRLPLKTILSFSDTNVCSVGILKVPSYFTGGDSTNYMFQWYYISSPKDWFPLKKGQNILKDTFNYSPFDPLEKLALVINDGCTNKADTAYLNISQRKPVVLKTTFRDTGLCIGHILNYKAILTGGVSKYYSFKWKDLITNTVLSNADSLKFTTSQTLKILLIVNDGCLALGDTSEFYVSVKPPLKATSNLRDTAICFGKTISYKATARGGDSKNYSFTWVLNNNLISKADTLLLSTNHYSNTSNLSLILKDNCSLPNDSIKKTITINPSPKADFTYDLACSRTITKFQFTGTKPASPITTYFTWNFNNEATSTLENPTHKFAAAGTSTSTLILASDNGCTDTLIKTIEIKPQSKADFETSDVCETDSAVFVNNSEDATGYNWKFGDGQNSKSQDPKHKFQIASTTTFNVTLVAVVNNGCSDSLTKALTVNTNPDSDFSFTTTGSKVDLRATVQGNTKYQWKFGNTDSTTTTVGYYTHNIKSSDQYNVCLKVTNLAGCISQTCKNVTVGISNISKLLGFKIYPNPNDGNFIIEIENPGKDISIEVYDGLGKFVKTIEISTGKKIYPVDLIVAKGIYLVRVKNGGVVWNQKVLVIYNVK